MRNLARVYGGMKTVIRILGGREVLVTFNFALRAAQIVFLVIIPKKWIYAADNEDFVYENQKFTASSRCEAVTKTTYPFYVSDQDLINNRVQIPQGTLLGTAGATNMYDTDRTFRILKTPSAASSQWISSLQKLSSAYADIPSNWYFQVTASRGTPLGSLKNKNLRVYHRDGKSYYQRCCTQNRCADLPIFAVFDKTKLIGTLAFEPGKNDFITSYKPHRMGHKETQLPSKPQSIVAPPASAQQITAAAVNEPAPAQPETPVIAPEQKVICTQSAPLRIYDDSLKTVLYKAPKYLPVKVYQDWSGGPSEKTVNGHNIVKVQLTTGAGEINGWAASSFIKPAQECKGMPLIFTPNPEEEPIPGATVVTETPADCCRFPTAKAPSADYDHGDGGRWFGATRKQGKRLHAAADLLRPEGEKVFSVDGGKVLRKYHFYAGTYAIEVKHDAGFVARYGEVAKKNVAQSEAGERVLKGQHIGYIGSLDMLHFELYSDKVQGPLTQVNVGQYWRRSDLMNPTPHLKKWQDMTF